MPVPPKDPAVRQRRNIKTEEAELPPAAENAKIPKLLNPDSRVFHKLAIRWWLNLWRSPMAARFLSTDADILGMTALLIDDFYKCKSPKERRELAAEIRQQTARFGLSNWDRNRMNWTVTEKADTKPRPQSTPHHREDTRDPRLTLRAVK